MNATIPTIGLLAVSARADNGMVWMMNCNEALEIKVVGAVATPFSKRIRFIKPCVVLHW